MTADVAAMIWLVLHGVHGAGGAQEWLLPLIVAAGLGAALLGRWIGRWRRHGPSDHDEPI